MKNFNWGTVQKGILYIHVAYQWPIMLSMCLAKYLIMIKNSSYHSVTRKVIKNAYRAATCHVRGVVVL